MYHGEVVHLLNVQSFYKVFHIINNILEQNWEEIFVICDRQKVDTRPKTERCWMMCTSCSINVCPLALDPLCMVASNAAGRKFASYLPFTRVTLFPTIEVESQMWCLEGGFWKVMAWPGWALLSEISAFVRGGRGYDLFPVCDSTRNSILCTLA